MTTETTHFKIKPLQAAILAGIAQGLAHKQIANMMGISRTRVSYGIYKAIKANNCVNCVELIYKLSKSDII
jgi:DNA-binding CsgD family transcriptional regulator